MNFHSPSKGEMELNEVIDDLLAYVNEDINQTYKILVGSDSHPRPEGTCFVSAIIVHRLGKGARYYYHKFMHQNIKSLRQRIFFEASLSLSLAGQISEAFSQHGREDMQVEVHLDVGSRGETRELIREVIGMIVNSGFEAKIKPDACAASKVADKYTK